MAAQLDHVAVETADFLGTVRFFTEVFDMEVARTRGEAPHRQLWFHQGIQVNETPTLSAGSFRGHIGIRVERKGDTLARAIARGGSPLEGKPGWFLTPEGVTIELMGE